MQCCVVVDPCSKILVKACDFVDFVRYVMNFSRKQCLVFCIFTLLTLCFEQLQWDFYIQEWFFNRATGKWLIDGADPFYRAVFYTGAKYWIAFLGVCVTLFMLVTWSLSGYLGETQQKSLFFIVCLIFVPTVVALLKEFTHVHCPSRLVQYGGSSLFRGILDISSLPDYHDHGKCFPAGHASGGFALMSLYFIFKRPPFKQLGLILGLLLGWIMALYQMSKGAHFLSHSLATMLLSWFVIILLRYVFKQVFENKCDAPLLSPCCPSFPGSPISSPSSDDISTHPPTEVSLNHQHQDTPHNLTKG